MKNNNEAPIGKIGMKDAVKAVIVSFIMTIVVSIYELIKAGGTLNWENGKAILLAAVGAALSYIVKNFLTNSDDQFLKKEN